MCCLATYESLLRVLTYNTGKDVHIQTINRISSMRHHHYYFSLHILVWLLYSGVAFISLGKPGDINDELDKVHTSDAVTTVIHSHKLQLLSPAVSRGIKLYNTICPSASPLTIIKNHMDICALVPHVVAMDTT